MRRLSHLLSAAGVAGFVLFFGLMTWLLLLRYERGDIYPPYSTLRADPLGTRAYYEALDSLPTYTVARGYTSLHRQIEQKPGTLLFLGLDANDIKTFTKDEAQELNDFVTNGGRVVITFAPQDPESTEPEKNKKDKKDSDKKTPPDAKPEKSTPSDAKPAPPPPAEDTTPKTEQEKHEREEFRKDQDDEEKDNPDQQTEIEAEKYVPSLAAIWGFGWDVAKVAKDEPKAKSDDSSDSTNLSDSNSTDDSDASPAEKKPDVLAVSVNKDNAGPGVSWKSALYFVRLEPEWLRLYTAKDNPVVVQRNWGKGEIVLATDSYFISNEGLRNDRRPALVSLLTGPAGLLVFDETHLGTQEQEGVMYLADKFHLEGYLYGMVGVVLLFLWRNSVPLVPPRAVADPTRLGGAVSGKDSRSGLVNLLRRNIATSEILKTSLGEWRRGATPNRKHLHDKLAAMESVLAAGPGSNAGKIVESYHQLREINTPNTAKGNDATKS